MSLVSNRFCLPLLVSLGLAPVTSADQPASIFAVTQPVSFQQPDAAASTVEPTLPELEVRPPVEAPVPDVPDSQQEPIVAPPVTPAAPADTVPIAPAQPQPVPVPATPSFSPSPRNATTIASSVSPADQTVGQGGVWGANSGILRGGGSLFDVPAAASVRSFDEISQRQAPDMFHALQNEVGVLMQATAAGQASPFVRGLTGQQVLILVDGIRLNNSYFRRGPNQYFNTIDPGMVDHIEVLRGQGSVLWGSDAIGGAINVVTRGADAHRGLCHQGYAGGEFTQYYNTANSSPYSRLNVESWTGSLGFFGGASYQNVRDLDTGFDDVGRQPGTNYQQYAGDLKLNYLLSESSMLTLSMQHFEQEDLPRSDRFPGYPQDRNNSNSNGGARFFDPQQRDLAYIRYQALNPLGGWFDAVTATASFHRQREVQTRGIPTSRFQETDVQTTGLQLVASRNLGDYGKFTTGFDWYHDDIDSAFGGSASGPIVPDDAWYRRAGWFLNWDVPLTDRLLATAGIRYESIETAGTPIVGGTPVQINPEFDDWVSQIGLTYRVNRHVNLFGSIAEGFRAPNLDDLMANNPNVLQQGQSLPSLGLRPEASINYEIGIKTNSARLRTQTSVFWLDLKDNIVSITAAPNTFASANQDSFVQGVEFNGSYALNRQWDLYGNFWYTYGRNEITDAPLSRVPPAQGILGLRFQDPCAGSHFSVYTWMSDRADRLDPVRDFRDERIPIGGTPGFATLNARWGKRVGAHRFSLSLENITDKAYLVHGSGVRGTGATARLGYSLSF